MSHLFTHVGHAHCFFRADRAARFEMEKKEKEEAKQQRQQIKETTEQEELVRLQTTKRYLRVFKRSLSP